MKKICSFLLALALCASLAVPAWADEVTDSPQSSEQIGRDAGFNAAPTPAAEPVTDPAPETEGKRQADFSDVPSDHTFYAGIMDCASKGIVSGYAEGDFRPTATVTRAHFTVMLSRAFYPDEIEANASLKDYGWFVPNAKALRDAGVLKNTSFVNGYSIASVMNEPISRYDMAQLMTNIMAAKGFSATESQKSEAQSKIADYTSVPAKYQDAVKNVYALGIIAGYDKAGNFYGSNIMNRGQGCVVIYRMMKYTPATDPGVKVPDTEIPVGPEPDVPSKPNPAPTGNSVITVSSAKDSRGNTVWSVGDNNYPTGYLNNGDPITEENVVKMLKAASNQWATGMSWTDTSVKTTNYYVGDNASIAGTLCRNHYCSTEEACSGFANMISNYVFGKNNNAARKITDISTIRPGDIVFQIGKTGVVSHVFIATGHVVSRNNKYYVFSGNGNVGQAVQWADWAIVEKGKNIDAYLCPIANATNADSYCIVYTRYPD